MAVNEQGVFVVETADELKAWMKDFHEHCDDTWNIPSCAVYAMLQFVESWVDNTVGDLVNALREAEAGLECAGADTKPPTEFIPSPTLALRAVRAAIAKVGIFTPTSRRTD